MLPGADCFVFDHRVVRWNFQRGDGTNPRHYTFSSDPRTIRDIVAAFELAWNRATPHAEYKPDERADTPPQRADACGGCGSGQRLSALSDGRACWARRADRRGPMAAGRRRSADLG